MTPGARLSAVLEILPLVLEKKALGEKNIPADKQLSDWFRNNRYAGSKDRQAIAGDVYGILRYLAQIDWWIKRLDTCPSVDWDTVVDWHDTADFEMVNRARVLVFKACTQNLRIVDLETDYFTGGQYAPSPLTGSEKRMLVELGNTGLDSDCQPLHVRGNFPEFLTADLTHTYGDDAVHQTTAMLAEAPVDMRVNILRGTVGDAQQSLHAEGIETIPCTMAPYGLRLGKRQPLSNTKTFRDGLIEIQDEGSQIIANLVGAKPKHKVVDFCAGAGGKTLAIAADMQNKGRIIACDISEGRLKRAGQRLKRAHAFIVERRTLSSERDKWIKRQSVPEDINKSQDTAGKGFDRVLVDAPCSGTGTWRRNPDQKWRLTAQTVDELVALQQSILYSSARLVKPGGRLIYATCSILARENQNQIDQFLKTFPNFFVVPMPTVWADENPNPCPVQTDTLQLTPHDHKTDGFFVAVLERKLT